MCEDRPFEMPNTPPGYRFLTNTKHQSLEDYLIVRKILHSNPEDLIMLDDAYSDNGTLLAGYKAVFRKIK